MAARGELYCSESCFVANGGQREQILPEQTGKQHRVDLWNLALIYSTLLVQIKADQSKMFSHATNVMFGLSGNNHEYNRSKLALLLSEHRL